MRQFINLQLYCYCMNPFTNPRPRQGRKNVFDELLKNQGKSLDANSFNFTEEKNENISQNRNVFHSRKQEGNQFQKIESIQSKEEQIPPIKGSVIFKMKVNHKQCAISDQVSNYLSKRLFRSSKINNDEELPKLHLQEQQSEIQEKMSIFKKAQKCLLPLSKFIEKNYSFLFQYIHHLQTNITKLQLYHPQMIRLMLGLNFYQPIKENCFQLQQILLKNHPLASCIEQVSRNFRLDILRSFYVAKQTYLIGAGIKPYENTGFGLVVDRHKIRQMSQFIGQASKFIEVDKANIVKCYDQLLAKNVLPSSLKLLKESEELNTLWLNIHNIESQGDLIQQGVLQIFTKYYKIAGNNLTKNASAQLEVMKRKLLSSNLNPNLKKKLFELNMNQMLEQGQFVNGELTGHYSTLVNFLIHRKEVDYTKAIENTREVITLDGKWVPYFEKYVSQFTFSLDQSSNLLKGIYIFKILQLLKSCKLSETCEKQLIKSISMLSIPLSILYLNQLRCQSLKVRHIKLLAKKSQLQLNFSSQNESSIIRNYLNLEGSDFIKVYLDSVEILFKELLETNDITFLEGAISSGKSITLSWSLDEKVLYCVTFYYQLLFQFKSQQPRIQVDLVKLFHKLKSLDIEIQASFKSYDRQLRMKVSDPFLIAKHLQYSLQLLPSQQLTPIIQTWFSLFNESSGRMSFDLLINFFISLSKISLPTADNVKLVEIQCQGIAMFKQQVHRYLMQNFGQKGFTEEAPLKILHLIKDLSNYCQLTSIKNNFLPNFFREIITELNSKVSDILDIINQNGILLMSQRLDLIFLLLVPLNDSQSTSSEVYLLEHIRQSKKTNLRTISMQICRQLKKQTSFDGIQLCYSLFNLDNLLSKMITQELSIEITESIKSVQKVTLLEVDHLIRILPGLQIDTQILSSEHQKQKIELLRKIIIVQIVTWFKQEDAPATLFDRLTAFLISSMNALKYQYHLFFLQKGMELNLISKISLQNKRNISSYGAYLLCIMIGRKKGFNHSLIEDQTTKMKSQIAAFTRLTCLILKFHRNKQLDPRKRQFEVFMLNSIIKILQNCKKQPTLSLHVKEHLQQIKLGLQAIATEEHDIFDKELRLVNVELSTFLAAEFEGGQTYDCSQCSSQQEFDNIYGKHLAALSGAQIDVCMRYQLFKMIEIFSNNPKFKLDRFILDKNIIAKMVSQQLTVFPFLALLQKLIPRISMSPDRIKAEIIDILMKMAQTISQEKDSIGQVKLTRELITSFSIGLKSGFISPFLLLKAVHPHIRLLLDNLSNLLFSWKKPNCQLFTTLNETTISVDSSMLKIHKNRFSLWNYLQYRERLLLVRQVLLYGRQMNGFEFNEHSFVETIIRFMCFLMKNDRSLRTGQTLRKFMTGKAIMSHGGQKQLLDLDFPEEPIDELTNICSTISHHLNRLGWEFTPEQIEKLAQLQRKK